MTLKRIKLPGKILKQTWREHSCLQRSHSCERVPNYNAGLLAPNARSEARKLSSVSSIDCFSNLLVVSSTRGLTVADRKASGELRFDFVAAGIDSAHPLISAIAVAFAVFDAIAFSSLRINSRVASSENRRRAINCSTFSARLPCSHPHK